LDDKDIPHCTKLSEMITARFKVEHAAMVRDIRHSLGRVATTADVWTRKNLDSHIAITAHYLMRSP
ncbi:hypothetical protein FIBSPDRAFT_708605, partial [Athelia psychrophila]